MTAELRRRVVLVVVLIIGVPLAVALAVQPETDPPGAVGDYLDCLPYTTPRSVADINRFVQNTGATPGFAGGDVGASTQLADGRSLWVFGDTTRPAGEAGASMVRNSLLVMGKGCASVYRRADNGAAVPDREDGVGYWPMSVVAVPDREAGEDRVAVGLMRVRATGTGMWDFEILGSSVAHFLVPFSGTPELVGVTDLGPDVPDLSRPLWGAAVEVVGDRVYVYGTSTPGGDYVFGYSLHVARTTVEDYLDETSWEYFDGSSWVRDATKVADLIPAATGVSRVLSVFEQDGSWYAVSKQYEFIGTEMVVWKSDSPTGPFVSTGPVAEIPSGKDVFQYMPLAHPDLLPRQGTVVVSWSVNAMDLEVVEQNPVLYRPKFRRVTLP